MKPIQFLDIFHYARLNASLHHHDSILILSVFGFYHRRICKRRAQAGKACNDHPLAYRLLFLAMSGSVTSSEVRGL